MDSSPKRPGSIAFLLVGLVLLVMVTVFITLIPVVHCPLCWEVYNDVRSCEDVAIQYGEVLVKRKSDEVECEECNRARRITLLHLWLKPQGPKR